MTNDVLIVFSRPLRKGFVKTRLAEILGDEQALNLYKAMFQHTEFIVNKSGVKHTFYYASDPKIANDSYKIQQGSNLGERMYNAIAHELHEHNKVCIIGCDCYELTSGHILQAYKLLNNRDVVIGPAMDGGYYLIGMKSPHRELFHNITWGNKMVLQDTLAICNKSGLSIGYLTTLADIDEVKDIPPDLSKKFNISTN